MVPDDDFDHSLAYALAVGLEVYKKINPAPEEEVPVGPVLRKYVEQCIDLPIEIWRQPVPSGEVPAVRGAVVRCEDKARVIIATGQRRCWERYVVCKELFQLLVDQRTQTFTTDVEQQLIAVLRWDMRIVERVAPEAFAMLAAIEYLLPYSRRPSVLPDDDENPFMAIAQKFRIPAVVVEGFYATDGSLKSQSDEYHEQLKLCT